MIKKNTDEKILFLILALKATHLSGIIISSYITIIFLGLGFNEQIISWIIASIGLTYPLISIFFGMNSDRFGRFKVYLVGKIISVFFILVAFFFTKNKILALCLYIVEAVENGIEPLIQAVATDNSNEKTRVKIFTWLSLGGSIGMMVISLVTALVMEVNMKFFISLLLILEILSSYFMYLIDNNKPIIEKKKENSSNDKIIKIIRKNIYLSVFAIISMTFSILSSQLNYSFALTLKEMFGKKFEGKFGILLSIYYFVTILFTIICVKKKTKKNCIDSLIFAGSLYTLSMFLIMLSINIYVLTIGIILWAVSQMLVGINNNVFVSENCEKNNVGIITVLFSIISCSGVVIGPIISGFVIHSFGIMFNWGIMTFLGALGTGGMLGMKIYKNGGKK